MQKRRLIILLFSGFLLLFFSCRVKRELPRGTSIVEVSSEVLIKRVEENNLWGYSFYLQKAVVQYNDKENSLSFYLSLKHDTSNRYLAVVRTFGGIELYRLYFDRDTFLLNDRLKRELVKGRTDLFLNRYGLGFEQLSLFLGDIPDYADLRAVEENCNNNLRRFSFTSAKFNGITDINCEIFKVANIIFNNSPGNDTFITFNNFVRRDSIIYPEEIEIKLGDRMVSLRILIETLVKPLEEPVEFIPGRNYEIKILN